MVGGLPLEFGLVWGNHSGLEPRTLKLAMTGQHVLCAIVTGREIAVMPGGKRGMRSLGGLNSMLIFFCLCSIMIMEWPCFLSILVTE